MNAPVNNNFMLIFRDTTPEAYQALSPEQTAQCLQDWNDWCDSIVEQGKWQHGHPLGDGGRVVTGARGDRVLDGPFAEAKEAIGGYFLITAADLDEATEIARRCPNLKHGMSVEVRPVVAACHLAHTLGRETMKA
jgi:hypothetical protein